MALRSSSASLMFDVMVCFSFFLVKTASYLLSLGFTLIDWAVCVTWFELIHYRNLFFKNV